MSRVCGCCKHAGRWTMCVYVYVKSRYANLWNVYLGRISKLVTFPRVSSQPDGKVNSLSLSHLQ